MKPGKSTSDLHLPTKAPTCFDTQAQWNQYREVAVYSSSNGFTYCNDCTEARKASMVAQCRCSFPRTVFMESNGMLIGKRVK